MSRKTDWAILIIGILLIAAITWVGISNARKYENPEVYWCSVLQEQTPPLSCDWSNEETPRLALKYWHDGLSPQEATIKAAQETEK